MESSDVHCIPPSLPRSVTDSRQLSAWGTSLPDQLLISNTEEQRKGVVKPNLSNHGNYLGFICFSLGSFSPSCVSLRSRAARGSARVSLAGLYFPFSPFSFVKPRF